MSLPVTIELVEFFFEKYFYLTPDETFHGPLKFIPFSLYSLGFFFGIYLHGVSNNK